MKSSFVSRIVALVSLLVLGALAIAIPAKGGYHLLTKYTFGAAEGSTREYFDYITVDSSARRVYLSHGTEIKVIHADTGKLIGNITGLKQDHGVALAHEFGRGFISDGGEGKVVIFDLKTLKPTGEAKADKDADCVLYDPASKRVFVMNGDPHSATVIDAKSGTAVGTIELGGGPEFAVADGNGTVYVNLEDKNEVVAIDSHKLTIKSRWPVSPAGGPTALALDREHHRLFSAGREPQMLVVMDSDTGHVIQSFPISAGVDAAAYEPETGLLFASTRDGMIHIFHEDSPDKFSEVETVKTEFGAKTMGLDTKTPITSSWIQEISVLPQHPPQTSLTRGGQRFRAHSASWFMANEESKSRIFQMIPGGVTPQHRLPHPSRFSTDGDHRAWERGKSTDDHNCRVTSDLAPTLQRADYGQGGGVALGRSKKGASPLLSGF